MAKIGAGSFSAWMRTGLREARNLLYPDSNVATTPEYGMYGTKTPGEVADARRSDASAELNPDEEMSQGSVLEGRLAEARSRAGGEDRSRGEDRER